jgi:hypothetical protein
VFAQHFLERYDIAGNDCFDRGLEAFNSVITLDGFGEGSERGPIFEAVLESDNRPGIGKLEGCGPHIGNGLPAEARVQPFEAPLSGFVA